MSRPIPTEFTGFVRETGVRAFDRLAAKAKILDTPLRTFMKSWTRLSDDDKHRLFDELIATVGMPEMQNEEPPAAMKQKRPVKRYDPEEVAATLPKKPAVRKTAPVKKSKKPAK